MNVSHARVHTLAYVIKGGKECGGEKQVSEW